MQKALLILFLAVSLASAQVPNACFSPTTGNTFTVAPYANSIVSADFNGDGHSDLAVSSYTSSNISVLLGNGTGSFSASGSYSIYPGVSCIVTADFNNDGNKDLAVCSATPFTNISSSVSVLLGSGTGSFTSASQFTTGLTASWMSAADLNSDGNADIAITNFWSDNVQVMMGSGAATFSLSSTYSVGTNPNFITSGFLNSDSYPDLVVTNNGSGNMMVMLGSSTGTFSSPSSYSTSTGSRGAAIVDFNGDGYPDIAVASPNYVYIFQGSSSGTLSLAYTYTNNGGGGSSIVQGDFNLDGMPDLAVGGSTAIRVLCGNNTGTIATAASFNAAPYGIVRADFNNDGRPDLACCTYMSGTVHVFLNAVPTITATGPVSTNCGGATVTLQATGANTYSWSTSILAQSISVAPYITTTYTVRGFAANGCSNTAAITVSVIPSPTITAPGAQICPGMTWTINPSGAASYTFVSSMGTSVTTGPIPFSPTTNIGFTVTGIAANGCTSSITTGIGVLGQPTVSVNSGTICAGRTFTVMPTGAGNYSIYSSAGLLAGPVYTLAVSPSVSTTYSVIGITNCISINTAVCTVSALALPTISINSGSICSGSSFTLAPSGGVSYTYSGGSAIVSPIATTNYTVTGAGSNSCISNAVSTVTVLPLPSVTVTAPAGICPGGSATLSATGANSYSWSTAAAGPSIVVAPQTNSTYILYSTDITGCTKPTGVFLTVYTPPVITAPNGSLCIGDSFTISPAGASSYTFFPNGPVVSPTVGSTFSVTGTSAQGCVSSNTAVLHVTVHSRPLVSAVGGTVCAGKSFTIIPSGASSYSFPAGSAIVTPSGTTSYSVWGTFTTGCVSAAPAVITVTAQPLPLIAVFSPTAICQGATATLMAAGALTYTWNNSFTGALFPATPSVTTTYTVKGTDANGCENIAGWQLLVHPAPLVTVNGGTVCPGGSFTLTPAGAMNYSYSGGSSVVSPTTTTTYSVLGQNAAGCANVLPALSTVSVMPAPPVFITSSDTVICAGETVTLTASGALSYTWSNGSHDWSIVDTPSVTQTYSLAGMGLFECPGRASLQLSVEECTALSESGSMVMKVYPNPSDGTVFIQVSTHASFVLRSIDGRVMLEKQVGPGITELELDWLGSGLYTLALISGQSTHTCKLVKN